MARGNHCSLAFGRLTAILVPPSEDAIALGSSITRSVEFRQAIAQNSAKRSSEWGFRLRKPFASDCVLILNGRLAELLGGLNDGQE